MSRQDDAPRRPGGRTARNREAILSAATAILLESGYEQLTFARVAAAAGVAETTIYRRWPTKAHLAADAITDLAGAENPIPDTGSFEGDLRALLTQVTELLRRPEVGRIVRTIIALADSDATVRDLAARFWAARFAGSAAIVARAAERGDVSPDADPHEVVEELVSLVYFRALVTDRPLDQQLIERSVDMVVSRHAPRREG